MGHDIGKVDTSALDGDPLTQLARKLYDESPFTTHRTWDPTDPHHWNNLSGEGRRYWYEKAGRQSLPPASLPPASGRPWWRRLLGR